MTRTRIHSQRDITSDDSVDNHSATKIPAEPGKFYSDPPDRVNTHTHTHTHNDEEPSEKFSIMLTHVYDYVVLSYMIMMSR